MDVIHAERGNTQENYARVMPGQVIACGVRWLVIRGVSRFPVKKTGFR